MQPQDFTRWHEVSLRDTEGGVAISSEIPRFTRNGVCVICGLSPSVRLCAPVISFFTIYDKFQLNFYCISINLSSESVLCPASMNRCVGNHLEITVISEIFISPLDN